MDVSLSTELSQMALATELNATMTRKGLEAQKIEGNNVLQLMASFSDPALGQSIDLKV